MIRTDSRLERALLALGAAVATVLLVTVPNGEPILTDELLPIATAVGIAVYASDGATCWCCAADRR